MHLFIQNLLSSFHLPTFHIFRHEKAAFNFLNAVEKRAHTHTRCAMTIVSKQLVALVKHFPAEAHIINEVAFEILQKSRQRIALKSRALERLRVRLNLTLCALRAVYDHMAARNSV